MTFSLGEVSLEWTAVMSLLQGRRFWTTCEIGNYEIWLFTKTQSKTEYEDNIIVKFRTSGSQVIS